MTVALASIPSSVAYANIAGVSPLVGVWSSVVLGAAAPALGSQPGVISGAASVVAVPLATLVAREGTGVVLPVIALSALIELLFAACRLGRHISLVTPAVMTGFLNGLGLLLLKSQLKAFAHPPDGVVAVGLALTTAALVKLIPAFSKAVPASLAAIVATSAAAKALGLRVDTLASTCGPGTFAGGLGVLPRLAGAPPDLSLAALLRYLVPAASIAFIAALETLLAAKVVDDASPAGAAARTSPDVSIAAMAGGNALSAALGGFGGCGLIPQTVLNAQSGGRARLSAAAYSLSLAAFVVFAARLVGAVPLPCLAGVMATVGAATVQWAPTVSALRDIAAFRRLPEATALLVASVVCFRFDMAAGIVLGAVTERALRRALPRRLGGGGA
ncbi:hypothetical protein KFE25_004649 [Diacronema lutheri]|uniref:SLC26A/SulP transporter domain-containing protein n=1 Tax=Diacronema lutheri TaxID=2081491 RepID=A0A8J5XEW9_DIALT|nr:hypothetical protein KFE25_004649 [Diacronema lutheri]